MASPDDVRSAMVARSTDELRVICTVDAPEYTADALDLARAELRTRGVDVATLVAATGDPRPAPRSALRTAGMTYLGLLVLSIVVSAIWGGTASPVLQLFQAGARVVGIGVLFGLWMDRRERQNSAAPK